MPPDVMREALIGVGLPVWQAEGLIEDYAHYRRGEASAVTSGVRDGTGRPRVPLQTSPETMRPHSLREHFSPQSREFVGEPRWELVTPAGLEVTCWLGEAGEEACYVSLRRTASHDQNSNSSR